MAWKKKRNKYGNKKTVRYGIKFDSIKEADRYTVLRGMQKKGEISELDRQVTFEITINSTDICKYIADFTYMKDSQYVVEDVKSSYTKTLSYYRLKNKLMKAVLGIEILET